MRPTPEDDEMLDLFRSESAEQLDQLERGLLKLEQQPHDIDALETVRRQTHNLKGASRILGLDRIEQVAHAAEDVFAEALDEEGLDTGHMDTLFDTLDRLRELVHAATSEEQALEDVPTADVVEQLRQETDEPTAPTEAEAAQADEQADEAQDRHLQRPTDPGAAQPGEQQPPEGPSEQSLPHGAVPGQSEEPVGAGASRLASQQPEPDSEPELPPPLDEEEAEARDQHPPTPLGTEDEPEVEASEGEVPAPPDAHAPPGEGEVGSDPLERARAYHIDTVRVDPNRLDVLMRQAGELVTATGRLEGLAADLEEAGEISEEVSSTIGDIVVSGEAQLPPKLRRDVTELTDTLEEALDQLETDASRLEALAEGIENGIQESRLLPMSIAFNRFSRAVRDLARDQGKQIDLEIRGETVRADKRVIDGLRDPLMHLIRNAVDHGIEPPEERRAAGKAPTGHLRLRAKQKPDGIIVEVEDDGRGIDPDAVRRIARERELRDEAELAELDEEEIVSLVFDSGFTTRETVTDVSGRGIGLGAVAQGVDQLDGKVHLDSTPGRGTRIWIEVPVRLSTAHVVLVGVGPHRFGIPIEAVARVLSIPPQEMTQSPGGSLTRLEDETVQIAWIGQALDLGESLPGPTLDGSFPCVVLRHQDQHVGLLVDELVGETELVVKPIGGVLRRVRHVHGASVLDDGRVCIILDPVELAQSVADSKPVDRSQLASQQPTSEDHRLLLVEDTEITRTQLKRSLEAEGYEVTTASDGAQALGVLEQETIDLVITDILMPNVDGFALTRAIRERFDESELPVVLVTTRDSEKETEEGRQAGANAFISKDWFDPSELLGTIERLIT